MIKRFHTMAVRLELPPLSRLGKKATDLVFSPFTSGAIDLNAIDRRLSYRDKLFETLKPILSPENGHRPHRKK